jgi:3-methyladenine DNA glycosylase Tag
MGVPSSYRAKRRVLSLQEMKETLEEREEGLEVLIHWQQTVAQSLELAITGSLGFWVTVGLLAGWSILKHQNPIVTSPDGRPRCFWATGYWQRYHDEQHGVIPASDRELFERLSLEILLGDDERKWKGQAFLHDVFQGFVPETVAALTREDIKQAVGQRAHADERLALDNQELVGMVIENAQRLQMFYRLQSQPNLDSTSAVLLRSWQVRGQQGQQEQDLAAFISHVRSFFRIPESTPLGTFLQAVGLLQGAHFGGCFLHQELRWL